MCYDVSYETYMYWGYLCQVVPLASTISHLTAAIPSPPIAR